MYRSFGVEMISPIGSSFFTTLNHNFCDRSLSVSSIMPLRSLIQNFSVLFDEPFLDTPLPPCGYATFLIYKVKNTPLQ
jgi:hypothetical protein